jgi:hypothetical protein
MPSDLIIYISGPHPLDTGGLSKLVMKELQIKRRLCNERGKYRDSFEMKRKDRV